MRRVRVTIIAREKQNTTYSECVSVALVIQHVKRINRIDTLRQTGCTLIFHVML